MPTQPVDYAGSFADEVFAVIHEETQVSGVPFEAGGREIGFLQGGAGGSERVDRVGLPVCPGGSAGSGHHLGRDPRQALAGAQKVPLESTRQVPTVLDGPPSVVAQCLGPGDEVQMVGGRGVDRPLRLLASVLVDRDDGGLRLTSR
jgi:hypothetical protein